MLFQLRIGFLQSVVAFKMSGQTVGPLYVDARDGGSENPLFLLCVKQSEAASQMHSERMIRQEKAENLENYIYAARG